MATVKPTFTATFYRTLVGFGLWGCEISYFTLLLFPAYTEYKDDD